MCDFKITNSFLTTHFSTINNIKSHTEYENKRKKLIKHFLTVVCSVKFDHIFSDQNYFKV